SSLGTDVGPATPRPAGPAAESPRYTRSRLHAKGGLGQVWLATDHNLGRDVALKELRPEQGGDPALLARFVEAARITGQLEHPGIVPVYQLEPPDDGRPPFYAMKYIRGRTFTETIRDYHRKLQAGDVGPLDRRRLLDAFLAVCNAVAYAH